MAKEQCGQELVPAVGHGTEKWRTKEFVFKKNGDDGVNNPLQIPLKDIESVLWTKSSWHFVAIFQLSMFTKHCEG